MARKRREKLRYTRPERHNQIEQIVATRMGIARKGMTMTQIAHELKVIPSPYVQSLLDDLVIDQRLDFVEVDWRGGAVKKMRVYLIPYDRLDRILDKVYGRTPAKAKPKAKRHAEHP